MLEPLHGANSIEAVPWRADNEMPKETITLNHMGANIFHIKPSGRESRVRAAYGTDQAVLLLAAFNKDGYDTSEAEAELAKNIVGRLRFNNSVLND